MKGYYTGYVGYTAMPMVYGKKNAFLAKLVVEYTDGRTQTIITDKDWDFTDEGMIINADYQQGEYIDARRKYDWYGGNYVKCGIIDWPDKVIPLTERFLLMSLLLSRRRRGMRLSLSAGCFLWEDILRIQKGILCLISGRIWLAR